MMSSHQRLELGARQAHIEVLGAARVGGDIGQIDVRLLARGQLDLGLLGALFEALQRQGVLAQIDALILLELVGQEIHDAEIEVLAAQEGVPVGGEHLELVLAVDCGNFDY